MSKGRTHSEAHQKQSKITQLVPVTEKQLETMKIIKAVLLELRNYSCCLSFSVYTSRYPYLKMPHPKAPMTSYHHKQVKHTSNISIYQKACHIDLLASMKFLRSITLYTQIHQFCNYQSQKLLRLTIFS